MSMTRGTAWALLAVAATLGLLAAGTAVAEKDPKVHPLTTAGDEGEVAAGVPVTLGWVLTNGDGQPAFHQDAAFQVTFEGQTLLSTTPASGHDYDGVDPYRVAFPGPGKYRVEATVHDDSTGEPAQRTVTYNGTVGPAPEAGLDLSLEIPKTVRVGQAATIAAEVTGPDGEPVDATEVTVRVRRATDSFEVLKTRAHAGDGDATLTYVFERSGTFEVTATAATVPGGPRGPLAADAVTETIRVDPVPTEASRPGPPTERPLLNARETGQEGEGYQLFGTYDPYTSVGPHGRIRLGMLTLDETTRAPASGVDYQASLTGPDGRQLFHSADLRAEDGFEYVTVSRPEVGTYKMRVDASKGDWSDHVVLEFAVLPPVGASNSGPLYATPNTSASIEAGQPTTFPVRVVDQAGVPLLHGEVDFRLVADDGVPVASGKLHVHENGTLPITLTPPTDGDYRVELLPQSLQPAPTPFTYGAEIGAPPVFELSAEGSGSIGDEVLDPAIAEDTNRTPGPGALGLILATGIGLAVRARRDREA